jgi:hypothetical protein
MGCVEKEETFLVLLGMACNGNRADHGGQPAAPSKYGGLR